MVADLETAVPLGQRRGNHVRQVQIITDSEICALCGGKLREGFTELVLKAGDDLAVQESPCLGAHRRA